MIIGSSALMAFALEPPRADARAAIAGRVIDAATRAPIEGAVVIATWWVELPPDPAAIVLGLAMGGHGASEQRVAYVSETLTDWEGRFVIAAWSASGQWRAGSLTSDSPAIRFFAPGYSPASTTFGTWTSGVMELYGPATKPRSERALRELRSFIALLDADVMFADSPGAAAASAARERVRNAQQHARTAVGVELRRAYGEKERP